MNAKTKLHSFFRLSNAEIQAYREMRERQSIAWATGNKSLANELGAQMRELRNLNPDYRAIAAE
jgi:hypothetical protein